MATTLATLLAGQTVTQVFQSLLGTYQANGFPVQSWQTGGTERTRLMAMATTIADTSGNAIPALAAGGFLDYAEALDDPSWIQLLAAQLYNLPYNIASFTVGNIVLSSAAGVGASTVAAGKMIAVFAATGNRYINVSAVNVAAGIGSVTASFQAEFAGASYADPSSSGSLTLLTPIAGVTLTNPAGSYTTVAHTGSGTGTLTLAGTPVGSHQVIIRIDSTGASGVAAWSYSLDGAPYVSEGAVAADANLGGTSINVTLTDGGSGTSFVINDTYLFNTPGSWITAQGSDVETATALAERCRNRWSSLSPIPVTDLYELLATSTPTVGSQVTQTIVVPDAVINDRVNIVVSGPAGALPAATVATIQAYVSPRVPLGVVPTIVSPGTTVVTLTGAITAYASQLAAAQTAIQTAMTNYVDAVGINGTVRLASIIELVMAVSGVIDFSGTQINGASANLTLGSSTSFAVASLAALGFTYVTV